MKNNLVLQVNNITKMYYLNCQKTNRELKDEFYHLIKLPFRLITRNNQNPTSFWALQDINFLLNQGEVLGIVGANGAGKSTLLKILAGIIAPTSGLIKIHGRVGCLLETGSSFHPELTGRENIFLSAAILGIEQKQVKSKFDEIVDFSGIKNFLDVPVKYYSSGMYVRLAFSIASQLEPDILLIDEVLSVGDANFQKKSLNKLETLAKNGNKAVVIISHNTSALRNLCNRGIYLKQGHLVFSGSINDCINRYLEEQVKLSLKSKNKRKLKREILSIIKTKVIFLKKQRVLRKDDPLIIQIHFHISKPIKNVVFGISLNSLDNIRILERRSVDSFPPISFLKPGDFQLSCSIQKHHILPGKYSISVGARTRSGLGLDYLPSVCTVKLGLKPSYRFNRWTEELSGFIETKSEWSKPTPI